MLDLPARSRCRARRRLDLLERVLDQLVLGVLVPGPRQLVLVEDAELHARLLDVARVPRLGRASAWNSSRISSRRGLPAERVLDLGDASRARFCARRTPSDSLERRASHSVPITSAPGIAGPTRRRTCGRASRSSAVRRYSTCGRLVLADVRHERAPLRRRRRRGRCRRARSSAHANMWKAEISMSRMPDHPLDHHLERRGRGRRTPRSLEHARRGPPPGRGRSPPLEMPMRSSISCGLVLGDGVLERDVARREPHVLVPGLVFPTRLVARVRLEQPAVAGASSAVPSMLSTKNRCRSPTVACADHRAEALDGPDAGQRRDRSARARPARGGTSPARRSGRSRATSSSGTSSSSVPNCSRCCCCHAVDRRARGSACAARGSGRRRRSRRGTGTPAATSGSTIASVASSSASVHVNCRLLIGSPTRRGPGTPPGYTREYTHGHRLATARQPTGPLPRAERQAVDPARRRRRLRPHRVRRHLDGGDRGGVGDHQADRLPPLRRPRRSSTGPCSQRVFDRLAEEFLAGYAQRPERRRRRPVAARGRARGPGRLPAALAARGPRAAVRRVRAASCATAPSTRSRASARAASSTRRCAEWAAQTLVGYLVEAVLNWLEFGDPAHDDEFVELATGRCGSGSAPDASAKSRRPAAGRGRRGAMAGRDAGLDLGELLGGHHRPQRRDRHLELVERRLARREPLQREPGLHQRRAPSALSMCFAAKRMTS